MTSVLDNNGFTILFPEVPTIYSSVTKFLSFILLAIMGEPEVFSNWLCLSSCSVDLGILH